MPACPVKMIDFLILPLMSHDKKQWAVLIASVTAIGSAIVYFGYKKYKKFKLVSRAKEIKNEGNGLFKNKKYHECLEKYKEAIKLTDESDLEYLNILNNISLTYFILRQYEESLVYSNLYLKIDKKNVKILKRRFETNRNLENNTETLTDAFILSVLEPEKFKTLGKGTLSGIVENLTEQKMKTLTALPGKISVCEYFDTFPDISAMYHKNMETEKNKEHTSSYKNNTSLDKNGRSLLTYRNIKGIYRNEKSTCSSVLFIKASIEHLLNHNDKALSIIKDDVFYYSIILREYLKVNLGERKKSKEFEELIKERGDEFAVLFYNTLISLQLHDTNYTQLLEKGLELYPIPFTMLKMIFLIQTKDYTTLESVLDDIKEYSIPICAISCEYFLMVNKYNKLTEMINKMKEIDEKDPRIPLFLGMLKEAQNEDPSEHFSECIERDCTFVKPYLLLGNYQMQNNDEKCEETFQTGLEYAVQREDVSSFIGALLLWDVQKNCTRQYPELFKTEK